MGLNSGRPEIRDRGKRHDPQAPIDVVVDLNEAVKFETPEESKAGEL